MAFPTTTHVFLYLERDSFKQLYVQSDQEAHKGTSLPRFLQVRNWLKLTERVRKKAEYPENKE